MLSAQLIPIKTIPVATGDQFLIYPSENLSIANLNLALNDSLLDPFINPARGNLIQGSQIVTNPSAYTITDNLGSAKTLPVAFLSRSDNWFGTFSLAIQEVTPSETNSTVYANGDGVLGNYYISGTIGRQPPGSDISLGLSFSWARLKSVGGVEYLYGRSNRIEQNGKMMDVRLGMVANVGNKKTLESTLVYNQYDVTHLTQQVFDVFIPERRDFTPLHNPEENRDKTQTFGLDLGYTQYFFDTGWQFGGLATINRKMHPKIPNYTIMSIRRDPGDTWAYNFGVGLTREHAGSVVGFDFIYEPIWSHTWADTESPFYDGDDLIVQAGDKTVENYFTFSNWIFRIGLRVKEISQAIDLGFEVRNIDYNLLQKDYRVSSRREHSEQWYEYTFSLGFKLFFKPFQISYQGRATLGTGIPSTMRSSTLNMTTRSEMNFFSDFLPAPSGELSLNEAIILSHRIQIAIPIGG